MWKYCMLATAGLALMAFTGCETAERVSAEAKTTTDRVLDRVLGEAACEGARADRARRRHLGLRPELLHLAAPLHARVDGPGRPGL